MIKDIWRAHQSLPRPLRIQWMAPATGILIAFLGFTFTLPPGPLCDEGMVLFMEGGCDWGLSNVFFFTKLGTMLGLIAAFVVAWREQVKSLLAFVPHFCVAGWYAWENRSGGSCDTYYSHPNGSEGQMIVELAAYAFLGVVMLRAWSGGKHLFMVLTIVACTATYVAVFYAGLMAVPHWTWSHTIIVAGSLSVLGVSLLLAYPRSGKQPVGVRTSLEQ